MDLPELDASEATAKAKTLCPWLPDPFECPSCGAYTDASETFDPHMVEPTTSWYCETCDQHYYREGY